MFTPVKYSDLAEKMACVIPNASALCECGRDSAMSAGAMFSFVAVESFSLAARWRSYKNLCLSAYATVLNASPINFP